MEVWCDRAHSLQGPPQRYRQTAHHGRTRQHTALEVSFVLARHDPGLIGNPRRVRTTGHPLSRGFHDALLLLELLLHHVAKNTALFARVVFASRAQLIKDTARNIGGRGQLRVWMVQLLPGSRALVLENCDVLETA